MIGISNSLSTLTLWHGIKLCFTSSNYSDALKSTEARNKSDKLYPTSFGRVETHFLLLLKAEFEFTPEAWSMRGPFVLTESRIRDLRFGLQEPLSTFFAPQLVRVAKNWSELTHRSDHWVPNIPDDVARLRIDLLLITLQPVSGS